MGSEKCYLYYGNFVYLRYIDGSWWDSFPTRPKPASFLSFDFTTLSNFTHLRALAEKTDYLVIVVIYDQTYVFMFCFVFFPKSLYCLLKG